ncbi:MAG: ABC transporter ATP-binding protein [Microthrixaceae bacterium]
MSSNSAKAEAPEEMIRAVDVRKSFDRGVVNALNGITLTVKSGEYVAITGPSGCGKSTLLHMLAALDKPDSGRLDVAGENLLKLRHQDAFRRHQIGLVFQMHNLLPHLSALDNVRVAMLGAGVKHHEQTERAQDLLNQVNLGDRCHRRPPELSGGERQRVAIARALANNPRILLADEPTGSLDSAQVIVALRILEKLRSEENVTVVTVTHDNSVAAAADRIIQMKDGQVVDAA